MKDVEGKVAFITGGGSGIGLGMAKVFTAAGIKVVIADIRSDHLDQALEQIGDAPVHAVRLDVTDRAAFARAADEVEELFGPVDIVCNNAGINMFAPMELCTYQDWDWILGVNLGGVVNGVQTFVPRLLKRNQGGQIVNTASMASFITGPGAGIYTTSKFAVRGLSECLRWNLAPRNIGVSVLCPGLVNSNIHESERIRPAHLASDTGPVDEAFMKKLPDMHKAGMDPVEVGRKVLEGIKRNDLYIFPHPEFREELREIFNEVLAALPEGFVDPRRLAIEEFRRNIVAKVRKH
jgi:NAD(P)-dependent dehydrogenase (short-subunit alcohol dehydrogenase family)